MASYHHTFAREDFKCDPYRELNDEVKSLFEKYFNANLTYVCAITKIAHALSKVWVGKTRIWNIYEVYIIQVSEQVFTMKSLAYEIAALAVSKRC
ncbi:unnamed protein product [Cylicocyclus nassatus]|uniref:Uncharacterized protein n=1 Tax=Cylicocyclus nassatus TaxID=53992 RepID=A0AA36DLU6_CYLNA|nr:unnamed protein product [Cylicocyclus nassatus]